MIKMSLYRYYFFGTCLRFLQDGAVNVKLRLPREGGVLDNIEEFLATLEELGLKVTSRAAYPLNQFLEGLSSAGSDSQISKAQSHELAAIMRGLRSTLDAEIQGLNAYVITPKRIDTDRLLNDVPGLLRPGTWDSLSTIARYDLQEAGKCIAFERPTAAAFHLMRATEDVIRHFYASIVKRGRKATMWGPIISDLRKRRAAVKHSSLLDSLDSMRIHFRNPTQHPDATYDIHEVQDMWSLATDVINRMARNIAKREAA